MPHRCFVLLLCALLLPLAGCGEADDASSPVAGKLRIGAATSVTDSGVAEALVQAFRSLHPEIEVEVRRLGSLGALDAAARGDVDVTFTHDQEFEERHQRRGFGINRRTLMLSDYVIVGPTKDPADIRGLRDGAEALARVRRSKVPFVSRTEGSGTRQREQVLWAQAGLEREAPELVEVAGGQLELLEEAAARQAYALSERAAFARWEAGGGSGLAAHVRGDPRLVNRYTLMVTNPVRVSGVHYEAAGLFLEFATSAEGQHIIASFGKGNPMYPLYLPARSGS